MKTERLVVNCPKCHSTDVVYSCEPECCFNHVCSDCLTNFQLVTDDTGRKVAELVQVEPRDVCDPTVRCANCGSLRVGLIEFEESGDSTLVCADCRCLLMLKIADL